MAHALEVSHLAKRFGTVNAVADVSFTVKEGEIVGLLGPNGAGKTTTIQMLLGLVTQDSGTIRYFGTDFARDPEACLSVINFASAYTEMQHRMTVYENLRVVAGLYGIDNPDAKIRANLELLEVSDEMDTQFHKLSSGQKTRVVLAKSLLNRPRLILMDEPTASLDPDISRHILDLIKRLQEKHKVAILMTSHNMAEVEELCDRVLFLDHGKIRIEDTPLGLTRRIGDATLVLTVDTKMDAVRNILDTGKRKYGIAGEHVVSIPCKETDIPSLLNLFHTKNIDITDIDIEKPSLEDVFLSIAKGTYESA